MRAHRQFCVMFAAASACLIASPAAAHPHVWATVRSEIVLGPDHRITAIRHAWTFDEFYTAMAIEGLDTDKDGTYLEGGARSSRQDQCRIAQGVRLFHLRALGGEDDKFLKLKPPVDYWAEYANGVLTLNFTLPLETPADTHEQPVAVDVYDPSFFVAFGFATEKPVTLTGADTKGCTAQVAQPDPETAESAKALTESFFSQLGPGSNFGSQFAQTVTIKCKDSHL